MGGAARGETKAPRPTAGAGAGEGSVPAEQPLEALPATAASPTVAAGASNGGAAVAAERCSAGGGGEAEEEDDEQVERFYALLDNIRALRGLYRAGDRGGGGGKRVREGAAEEVPWRPAFRMEDFQEQQEEEEVDEAAERAGKKKKRQSTSGGGGSAWRPAAGGVERDAGDGDREGDGVVEPRARKLGRRVAARG